MQALCRAGHFIRCSELDCRVSSERSWGPRQRCIMLFVKKFVHMWMCRHELWKWALEHEVFLTCMWPVHIVLSVRWSFYISMGLLTEEFYFLKYTVVLLVYNIYIYILRYIYISTKCVVYIIYISSPDVLHAFLVTCVFCYWRVFLEKQRSVKVQCAFFHQIVFAVTVPSCTHCFAHYN